MACGLGAIIIVLMLVKFNDDVSVPEIELLKADIARLEAAENTLQSSMEKKQRTYSETSETIQSASEELARIQTLLKNMEEEVAKKKAQYETLKKAVEQIETVDTEAAETEDVIEEQPVCVRTESARQEGGGDETGREQKRLCEHHPRSAVDDLSSRGGG